MSEQSERVLAWREKKRQDGYQPLTIYLKAEVKHHMEDVAHQRRQEVAEMLTEAFHAWKPAAGSAVRPEAQRIRGLVRQEVQAEISKLLRATAPPLPVPDAESLPPPAPRPKGMKRCKQGHAYPVTKKECPQCARDRKRRQREAQAKERAGVTP